MAIIEALVIKNNAGDIKLSASRKGGCSGCAQSKACALTWNPGDDVDDTSEIKVDKALLSKATDKRVSYANLQVGDTISLECNEQNLLKYICILFIPSLLTLLMFSLLVAELFPADVHTLIIVAGLAGALSLGALVSRYFLAKHSHSLLHNSVMPVK